MDVAWVVTAEVLQGDSAGTVPGVPVSPTHMPPGCLLTHRRAPAWALPSEETAGCVRVVGAVPACVEEEAMAVARRLGVCVGTVGGGGEPSPVLGVSVVLAMAGVVSVAGEPVGDMHCCCWG